MPADDEPMTGPEPLDISALLHGRKAEAPKPPLHERMIDACNRRDAAELALGDYAKTIGTTGVYLLYAIEVDATAIPLRDAVRAVHAELDALLDEARVAP